MAYVAYTRLHAKLVVIDDEHVRLDFTFVEYTVVHPIYKLSDSMQA
jgi:hypothetical protein